jgi:hypothetical protein
MNVPGTGTARTVTALEAFEWIAFHMSCPTSPG